MPIDLKMFGIAICSFACCICMLVPSAMLVAQTAAEKKSPAPSKPFQATDVVDEARLPNGRLITPAGDVMSFPGRPVDLVVSDDGQWLFVKDRDSLRVIDIEQWKEIQKIKSPEGSSLIGLAAADNGSVYFTDAGAGLIVYSVSQEAKKTKPFQLEKTIPLPADSFPCGIELSPDNSLAWVCLSKLNSLAVVDLKSGSVAKTIDVGVAPFDAQWIDGKLLVSNIGGRRPADGDLTAPSAGTETVVDERGVASTGTVSIVDLEKRVVVKSVAVGLHPTVIAQGRDNQTALVCNTNEDTVSEVNLDMAESKSFVIKLDDRIPFGSMPSCIHCLKPHQEFAIALAGNNAIAIAQQGSDNSDLKIKGLIPTAWYPVAIVHDETFLYVACTKGLGARAQLRDAAKGRNSHDALGVVQRIRLDEIDNPDRLKMWTRQVHENSQIKQILANIETTGNKDTPPLPIPERLGDPSVFKHVIYVIKENRTFDQVFGDMVEARSDPKLCLFPEKITPNHHALAKRFGVLDNYYCNGVLSADGHSWATEGNVTPYLERAFGGFARSYTFGDDPITYSSTGFVWDHVLTAGLSFRNYGEMDYAEPPDGMKFKDIWDAYINHKPIQFKQNIGIERLRRYSCREFPGWNMQIPDVLRMERFLAEFRKFEADGGLPHFSIVYLPQDHFGGAVTSEAHMADNDLALGRLVEAVSHSRFWKSTLIIVNEDDPQGGFDHIDGHRSLCLVVSAYCRPGVNHNFYNQTSALRTMMHVLGLPPMNQQDSSAPLMSACFSGSDENKQPYDAIEPTISLSQLPQPRSSQSIAEQRWREILKTVPIERTGMKSEQDEDNLNRFVWHEVRGWKTPYPKNWAGAHGKGLQRLGLRLEESD